MVRPVDDTTQDIDLWRASMPDLLGPDGGRHNAFVPPVGRPMEIQEGGRLPVIVTDWLIGAVVAVVIVVGILALDTLGVWLRATFPIVTDPAFLGAAFAVVFIPWLIGAFVRKARGG